MNIYTWISQNASAFVSLASAIIAASVALIVFALSQYITKKRDRTQFLLPKLEELYLYLNQVAEDNVTHFKFFYMALNGDAVAKQKIATLDDLEVYGHRTAKKIIMYIRPYFPDLSEIHQKLFAAQQELNQNIYRLSSNEPPDLNEIIQTSGNVSHFIGLMEDEIIRNRDSILGDYYFYKKYRKTTKREMEAKIPPPDEVIMNLPNK